MSETISCSTEGVRTLGLAYLALQANSDRCALVVAHVTPLTPGKLLLFKFHHARNNMLQAAARSGAPMGFYGAILLMYWKTSMLVFILFFFQFEVI